MKELDLVVGPNGSGNGDSGHVHHIQDEAVGGILNWTVNGDKRVSAENTVIVSHADGSATLILLSKDNKFLFAGPVSAKTEAQVMGKKSIKRSILSLQQQAEKAHKKEARPIRKSIIRKKR